MPESTAVVTGASQRSVPRRTPQTERIGAFSDGVFAVIITIMATRFSPNDGLFRLRTRSRLLRARFAFLE
jgi:uncharacterized membrane protein